MKEKNRKGQNAARKSRHSYHVILSPLVWMRQPVLRKLKIRDTVIFLSLWEDHVIKFMWDWERYAGKRNEGGRFREDGNLPHPLLCLSPAHLTVTCQSEYWTLSTAVEGPTNKHLFLSVECPVNTSGLIRNGRSIVDRIFTGDGLAFPACGSDHYQPIEIAIKELLPINLAVLSLIEAGMICLLGRCAFKNDSMSQFVDNAV